MSRPPLSRGRRVLFTLILLLFSFVLFVATGEIALRIIYRDGGRTTIGAPGPNNFDYLYAHDGQRGRVDSGPRRPGVPRLLALGDSITWGVGVRDWRQVWPELVARGVERKRGAVDMTVIAAPGRSIADHDAALARLGAAAQADAIIYQWYVNDLELVLENRPQNTRAWQQWPTHHWLRTRSYLYFFMDNRLSSLLPQPDRSYVDYILQDFVPGTERWAAFERSFHDFATRAKELAPTRILVLYPQVPFRDTYPLQPVNDRMIALAKQYEMTVVDLTNVLNTFDTHVSIFDAHPNERAQAIIADQVLAALEASWNH